MAMTILLKRMGYDVTAYGFRSTFRDWVAETTTESWNRHSRTRSAMALRRHRRGDLFEKRRQLRED